MAFKDITTYTAARTITVGGTTYNAGQTIPESVIVTIRHVDALLSRKFIIPTPDPHSRKTKPSTPTPVSLPASVRKEVVG